MERTYIHGKYLEEGAIRCDGKSGKQCCAATFIVIPTFKLQPLELPSILKAQPKAFESSDHPPRPLMQTTVNMASTLEEDKRQATFSSKLVPKDQAIHVVQTWILVINDKLLVTYSPSTLQDIAGPNIEFEDGKQDDGITIRVGTTFDGAHYFPAEKCKTWFEFQAELKKVIRPSGYETYKEKDATISCKDGTVLDSHNWAAKLGENRLKLFRVTLELKDSQATLYPPPGRAVLPVPPHNPYALVPSPGGRQYRSTAPPSRIRSRQPSDVDFENNPNRGVVAMRDRSRQRRSESYSFYHPGEYGPREVSPYRRPPINRPYDHSNPTVPGNPHSSSSQNDTFYSRSLSEEHSGPAVSDRGRHDPASSGRLDRSSSSRVSPRAPSLESRDRLGTTITDVADETDIPSRYDRDGEDSEDSRRRSRRQFPLALPAPLISGERESRPYSFKRSGSEEPTGESSANRAVSPTEDLTAELETSSSSTSSESDTEDELPQSGPIAPRRRPANQPEMPGSRYRDQENSGRTPRSGDWPLTKQSTESGDIHVEKLTRYKAEEPELEMRRMQREHIARAEEHLVRAEHLARTERLARAGHRVTFAPSVPGRPSLPSISTAKTTEHLPSAMSDHVRETANGAGRHYLSDVRLPSLKEREEPKPQDHDSIFFYLPSERPAEKENEKGLPDQTQSILELPKVLPVFQWLTQASAQNKLIERQFLSRKRSASRGSRNSNTLKKAPPAEVEASDESYSILKSILNELHRRLETSESKHVHDAYISCGSSDYVEVEKSLKEIENATLLSADSPEKTRTIELISQRKKILDLCRKIFSFFIPQNWKDGELIGRLWYSILQVVTVELSEDPQLSCSDILPKLESINRHIQVIVTGVAGDNIENPRYRIPSALFEAFLQFAEAMLLTAVEIGLFKCYGASTGPSPEGRHKLTAVQHLVYKKFDTCKSRLREGKFQLMCMILTGRTKDQMNYEEACAETIVAFILRSSICLPITTVEVASSPISIYRERLTNINIEANYRPQQRILQDILNLGAEVSAFTHVRAAQYRVLMAVDTLLHPKGSLDMKEPRSPYSIIYSPPRGKMGGGMEDFFRQEGDYVQDHFKRTKTLYDSVEEALSLKEEGNGKAIMVFTIVTTVFLPLNFVTSFFGMNTTDIRDIDRDQRIFWMIAIPVTIFVLGFALCWAYIGDSIQDRLFGPYSSLGQLFKGRLHNRHAKRATGAIVDEEEEKDENNKPAPKYEDYARSNYEIRRPASPPYHGHHYHHHDRVDPPSYYDRSKDRGQSRSRLHGSRDDYTDEPSQSYGSRNMSSGYENPGTHEEETRRRRNVRDVWR